MTNNIIQHHLPKTSTSTIESHYFISINALFSLGEGVILFYRSTEFHRPQLLTKCYRVTQYSRSFSLQELYKMLIRVIDLADFKL
ncbi:hypothetical protein KUTeg_019587 [Tegillarca granosa]|uniref:Uncharacterized protein n=1 Tax=Tegillarca granosa TaxID=220873 RepID=A0ABQ9EH75_TEGGR|nr:hypothetical protein KUTeg_019587 [Tegillarca granosa]